MGNQRGVKIDYKEREQRRIKAGKLFMQGISQAEVARALSVSRQSTGRWHQTYLDEGLEGLEHKGQIGRPSKMTGFQKERLQAVLAKGARKYGFALDLWTLPRIAKVIEKEFEIKYRTTHIWWIMSSLGWSCQRPAKRAIERDEEKIRNWKKIEWRRIKKKP
jgi:Transposase and inactivated derivatives